MKQHTISPHLCELEDTEGDISNAASSDSQSPERIVGGQWAGAVVDCTLRDIPVNRGVEAKMRALGANWLSITSISTGV